MPIVKIVRNGQITLPKEFRDALGVKEGDFLEVEMKKNQMVLKPKMLVDKIPESEFELSEMGKKKVREAFEDIKKGAVSKAYNDVDEMIKDLNQSKASKVGKRSRRDDKGFQKATPLI